VIDWQRYKSIVTDVQETPHIGRVVQAIGLGIETGGPDAKLGDILEIESKNDSRLMCEVVGFKEDRILLMPFGDMEGIGPGSKVVSTGQPFRVRVGESLLGRVLDGLGKPIDDLGPIHTREQRPIFAQPPHPLKRQRIKEPLPIGIKAIDGFATMGRGQRLGIFAGSGVGKSTLLGMVARGSLADINVIALVGERGREVLDFIEKDLGQDGLDKSVVVVATSDQPALVRVRAPFVATTIAEYFRDLGFNVMFMMDSATRLAMAQREVGLTSGEPPTTKGYPPSVFGMMPRLLERAGQSEKGSITGIYTVLVDGDDLNDPIADSLRSILDGHIVLSRKIAERNQFPAVDILASVSRLMCEVTTDEHQMASGVLRDLLAAYSEAEDLIQIGAYVEGSTPRIDKAIGLVPELNSFLKQLPDEKCDWQDCVDGLINLAGLAERG
jgi:flagellum-specific ATP synthase